ncbi:MAG: hypothetical protein LQ339_002834 [Xanthoria mediterranea]|nr:MAG: hypothetical protein LQ339_002834 [Xanthoria mediterranea]
MASSDPGCAPIPTAEGPLKDAVDPHGDDRPVAPDQFNPIYETSTKEIWAYYAYYIGDNGLTLFNFAPTAFQNLLYQAAGDAEVLHFAGRDRTINSIVLLANGISFAIQVLIFLVVGSYADFGSSRPNILIVLSVVAFGIGFGWLGVHTANKWEIAAGMYVVGLIAYQTTLTFWTAAFPGLARNTPQLRTKAEEYNDGIITRDDYDHADMMQRSRLANMAFYIQSCGEIVILAVIVGVLFAVDVRASEANNNWGLSVLIAFATGVWLLLAIPWFVIEKRRPGEPIPPHMNIVTAGIWQLHRAITQIWHLKQSLLYLIGYFLLGDSLNTSVTVIATLQNSIVAYDTLTLTYLLLVGIAAQAAGIYTFWWLQRRFRLGTKTMITAVMAAIVVLDAWGMIGIWTPRFGFHAVWEVWLYQAFYGLLVCPWYSYSQIMISEVTPRGKEFLFFSLFSIVGKTSAFIGPLVSSAIIDASPSGNNSTPFYFLFALSAGSAVLLGVGVDLKRSRREQERFLEDERVVRERLKGASANGNGSVDS